MPPERTTFAANNTFMIQRFVLFYFASVTFFACAQDKPNAADGAAKNGLSTGTTEIIVPGKAADEEKLKELDQKWQSPYDIEVDQAIFDQRTMNEYKSSKYPKARLLIVIDAGNYEAHLPNLQKINGPRPEDKVVERKEVTLGNKKAFFLKMLLDRKGNKIIMLNYAVPADDSNTFLLTGTCEPADEATLRATFEKAAATIQVNEVGRAHKSREPKKPE